MKKYECVKPFTVDSVDENGADTEDYILIKTGSIWTVEDTDYRIVGGDVRLISEKYGWLKKEVPHFARPEKYGAAIPQIRISKYQTPDEMLDVCQDCSNELLTTLVLRGLSEDE